MGISLTFPKCGGHLVADLDRTERETRAEIAISARGIAQRSVLIFSMEARNGRSRNLHASFTPERASD